MSDYYVGVMIISVVLGMIAVFNKEGTTCGFVTLNQSVASLGPIVMIATIFAQLSAPKEVVGIQGYPEASYAITSGSLAIDLFILLQGWLVVLGFTFWVRPRYLRWLDKKANANK